MKLKLKGATENEFMSVGETYLLALGIIIIFALAGGFFIMWNARDRAKQK